MKLLLIYPPFCTPSIIPFSISNLKGFVKANSALDVKCLDLNAKFHKLRFNKYYEMIEELKAENDTRTKNVAKAKTNLSQATFFDEDGKKKYAQLLNEFHEESKKIYSENNRKVVNGEEPEFLKEILELIEKKEADYIAFSLVYNSQNFYTKALIEKIGNFHDKICFIGGPGVSPKLKDIAQYKANEIELMEALNAKVTKYTTTPDFEDYDEDDYLTKEIITPAKSSIGCHYGQCAFCTHPLSGHYFELPIETLPKADNLFFIDDMIPTKRLLEIAEYTKKNKSRFWTQLKPTADLIPHLNTLAESGMKSVAWGIESGSQKMLKRMRKGINVETTEKVLKEAKKAGIVNIAFIMFGFPGETKEDFMQTIEFLERNKDNIDLVSTSLFGLQYGSDVFNNPQNYNITKITEKQRTVLEPKLEYEVREGMSHEEAKQLKKSYSKTIANINTLPKILNYMKEQTLFF